MDSADAFASTTMFEGTWKSVSVSGSIETARGFYEKFLPDSEEADKYFDKINTGEVMLNIHAQGSNILKWQRFIRTELPELVPENEPEYTVTQIGEEQTIDLTVGTMDNISGAGDAKVDLHWNKDHSAIFGNGVLPGCTEEFSALHEITDDGNTLVKTFTLGTESWKNTFKKASDDVFANSGMYEGSWKSALITGDIDAARDFYLKLLPGKNIDEYFSRINNGTITCTIHAPGSNMLKYHEFASHGRVGPELTIDLGEGTLESVAGFASVDLHWNATHTAIEGVGKFPDVDEEFSSTQEVSNDRQTLLRQFKLGDKTWTIFFYKDHGFLTTQSFEGTWQSDEITGATDAAKKFYATLLPGKDIDNYFALINNKKMMNSIHATGLNTFTRETYYLDDSGVHVKCGDVQKIDLTEGTPDPIAGAGNATIDLHWDTCHAAFVGNGKIPEFPEGYTFRAELEDDGKTLVRTSTLGTQTWSVMWTRQ